MKKVTSLFILLASVQLLHAQMPSNCNVPASLQYHYERDVKHIALQRIYDQWSPYMDSIVIPQEYQDTVWEALAAVFNLTGFPARDTVFDMYCIHQYWSDYIFYDIVVGLDSTCPWLQQWQNLITTTGVPALDTLLSTYGFTVTDFLHKFNSATLTTEQIINVFPLCDSIRNFDGVVYAERTSNIIGDGDSIVYYKTGTDRYFDFVIGYGDCPSGCTGGLTLSFIVYEDCSVQYSGSIFNPAPGGWPPFPSPVNCNITTGLSEKHPTFEAMIFPNPALSDIQIRSDLKCQISELNIYNCFGQKVFNVKNPSRRINISSLTPGLYIVEVISYNGRYMSKLIVE